jgi:diacylglycerol kinase
MQFWLQKFTFAFRGIFVGIVQEPSLRVHVVATLAVIAVAIWLQVSFIEAALLSLAIGGVWTAELMNSALERLARVFDKRDDHLRDALDLAAGAVLMMSFAAVAVGVLTLGWRLWK